MEIESDKYLLIKRIPANLSTTAITKVMEAMVLTIDATKVGEVYLKLAKYMFRVKPTLQLIISSKTTVSLLIIVYHVNLTHACLPLISYVPKERKD